MKRGWTPAPTIDVMELANSISAFCINLAKLTPEQLTAIVEGVGKIIEAQRGAGATPPTDAAEREREACARRAFAFLRCQGANLDVANGVVRVIRSGAELAADYDLMEAAEATAKN